MNTWRQWGALTLLLWAAALAIHLARQHAGWTSEWVTPAIFALAWLPLPLAGRLIAQRRRAARRSDTPDSVEFQAAHQARSAAFDDAVILGSLLALALAVAPGPVPALWGLGYVVAIVLAVCIRYRLALDRLGG